jgi:hypothetical protein
LARAGFHDFVATLRTYAPLNKVDGCRIAAGAKRDRRHIAGQTIGFGQLIELYFHVHAASGANSLARFSAATYSGRLFDHAFGVLK